MSEAYRISFASLCEGTVERLLADATGRDILDVGSGTGALARRAAAMGRVAVAVDPDPDMAAMSATAVPGSVIEASLPELPFGDDRFDAVTTNFVINHVDDPRAAMSELARVLRPGGRMGATIWTSDSPPWAALLHDAFGSAGVVPVPGQRLDPALDFERSVDGLAGLAEVAGLQTIIATQLTWDWHICVDALWAGVAGGVATIGQTFVAQPADVQCAAERAFRQAASRISVDGMLRLPSSAAYVVAG